MTKTETKEWVALKRDLASYIKIAAELATENEQLRERLRYYAAQQQGKHENTRR